MFFFFFMLSMKRVTGVFLCCYFPLSMWRHMMKAATYNLNYSCLIMMVLILLLTARYKGQENHCA